MKIIIVLFITLTIALFSCTIPKDNTHKTESGISFVSRYEILETGMKYIMYREVDGGLFIINITKDSLETEFIRKQLNK